MQLLEILLLVLGGAFVAEGLLYALFPDAARQMVEMLARLPADILRTAGVVSVAAGVFLFWLARALS
ncbi:MAG: DUF2065 domain-containing protein [Pseudomonadota bacterium]